MNADSNFMRENPRTGITRFSCVVLFTPAYNKTASVQLAVESFRVTRIYRQTLRNYVAFALTVYEQSVCRSDVGLCLFVTSVHQLIAQGL